MSFPESAFRTWPTVFTGGACFAVLFGVVVWMGELVLLEQITLSPSAYGMAAAAFVGYVGVASVLRRSPVHDDVVIPD